MGTAHEQEEGPLPTAHFLPACSCHPTHQHVGAPLQGDPRPRDVNVELLDVVGGTFALRLPFLATDCEERQVQGGVAHLHQDICAGAPDGVVTAFEAHVLGAL